MPLLPDHTHTQKDTQYSTPPPPKTPPANKQDKHAMLYRSDSKQEQCYKVGRYFLSRLWHEWRGIGKCRFQCKDTFGDSRMCIEWGRLYRWGRMNCIGCIFWLGVSRSSHQGTQSGTATPKDKSPRHRMSTMQSGSSKWSRVIHIGRRS